MRLPTIPAAISLLIVGATTLTASPPTQQIRELRDQIDRLRLQLAEAEAALSKATVAACPQQIDDKAVVPVIDENPFPVWSYTIRLPITYGYESNPSGLSDDLPRAAGLSHKGSTVIRLNPSLRINIAAADTVAWLLRYDLLHDFYQQRADINTDAHTFLVSREQKFNDKRDILSFFVRDDIFRVDEEGNLNQFSFGPTWEHVWDKDRRWSTIGKYGFNWNDFALSNNAKIAPVSDPDSYVHIVGIAQKFILRQEDVCVPGDRPFSIAIGYEHSWQDADGADVDRRRNRLTVETDGRPFPKSAGWLQPLALQIVYRHDFDEYTNPHSASGTGFAFDRSDNIDDLTVVFSYPFSFFNLNWSSRDKVIHSSLTASYHYDRRDSNILGQDKDNHVVRFGIVADF